jgi:hypothetical protein
VEIFRSVHQTGTTPETKLLSAFRECTLCD